MKLKLEPTVSICSTSLGDILACGRRDVCFGDDIETDVEEALLISDSSS